MENSIGKVVFSNFGHVTFFAKLKLFCGRHFEPKHFLIVLFADIRLSWVLTHMVQVPYRNSYGKVLKRGLCINGSEK